MKKTATAEQIAGWTRALVTLVQASLPHDHPHCSVGPGRYGREEHQKAARAALKQMAAHGVTPPAEDEIARLANGGVDIEAFRAHRALAAEINVMRRALEQAHKLDMAGLTALADALRPVVDRMQAALPAEEKNK